MRTVGQMTERPKVHDWKSCVPPKGTVGSNPTLSAIYEKAPFSGVFFINEWFGIRTRREADSTVGERQAGVRRPAEYR